jgi:hypothetical protein
MPVEGQAIVVKRFRMNGDTGLVRILFTSDQDGNFKIPSPEEFPNTLVWISSGYVQVDSQFKEGEPFLLDRFSPTDDSDTVGLLREQNRADYWTTGKAAKPIEDSKIIPVINSDLPDIANGAFPYTGIIPAGQFFIRNDDSVYGPFHAIKDGETYKAEPHTQMILSIPPNYVAKIPCNALTSAGVMLTPNETEENHYAAYITSLRDIHAKAKAAVENIDYISNTQLINFFAKAGYGKSGSPLGRKQAEVLKAAITEQSKTNKILNNDPRTDRLKRLLDSYLSQTDVGEEIIHGWLATTEGKKFTTEFLIQNKSLAPSPYSDQERQEHDDLQQSIVALREKFAQEQKIFEKNRATLLAGLEEERIKIREEMAARRQEDEQAFLVAMSQEVQDLAEEKKTLENDIAQAKANLRIANKAAELETEIGYLERNRDVIREAIRAQENVLKNPMISEKVSELHWHLELLNGHITQSGDKEATYCKSELAKTVLDNPKSIISAIAASFEAEGRSFTYEEMANLIITTQQSLMTVMKGRPGSGKTSSAIRLAQAHRLVKNDGVSDDFLNVPVSRGWVSGRDFLGYYNPLKNNFQSARTGVYQFLKNGELVSDETSIRFILLDEANLSPIEHYLSDFIGLFDPEGRSRPISTGSPHSDRYLKVAPNVRLIATINSDGTTEPLSPRMCDRVPVISMDYEEAERESLIPDITLDGAIPYSILEKFFGYNEDDAADLSETNIKIRNFIENMKSTDPALGMPLSVSARKQNAIARYFHVAQRIISETKAADFAISQYLLPLINGTGSGFGSRITSLRQLADSNGFERTKFLLDDILAQGKDNIDNFSFF